MLDKVFLPLAIRKWRPRITFSPRTAGGKRGDPTLSARSRVVRAPESVTTLESTDHHRRVV